MIDHWKAPIDEVLGVEAPPRPHLSIPRLTELGVEKAIETANRIKLESRTGVVAPGTYQLPCPIISKMKYRDSGQWFNTRKRRDRLLGFSEYSDKSEAFEMFMNEIESTSPGVLLDIASGGGFGVSHQLYRNRSIDQAIAIERDLKCLPNIQYRFKHIGCREKAEAVGGDVRCLPLKIECIDTAMMLQALPEISGIKSMLSEVHRVLKPGGFFVAEVSEKPYTGGLISDEEFARFADITDLYSGYEKFLEDGVEAGFNVFKSERIENRPNQFIRLISLRRT